MNNTKKNIHSSGPLGMLIKNGQVKKIDNDDEVDVKPEKIESSNFSASYFRTQAGIEFNENELLYVDPTQCEPWAYANRLEDEMGQMDELIQSIQVNKQLQPALIRPHPKPHDNVKYEIIFGRRRHLACLTLGVPFLVIKKEIHNIQDAIASQDAENKFRKNVSNYSNALLYKKLLQDRIFPSEKELAKKLGLSSSTLNDLMAYAKIPADIAKLIPDIHNLSNSMAIKITSFLGKKNEGYARLREIATEIGKGITSPAKLEKVLTQSTVSLKQTNTPKIVLSKEGKKLFTYKWDQRGLPCIVLHKDLAEIDQTHLCNYLKVYFEQTMVKSGYPDMVEMG